MSTDLLSEIEAVAGLADRLYQLSNAAADQHWNEFSMRVPAEPDRDADLVLARVAKFLRDGRADIAAAVRDARLSTGPELFRFTSFADWVNHAQDRFIAARLGSWEYVCIDATGRICKIGKQFMSARDRNAFPVIVYHIDPEHRAAMTPEKTP